MFDEYKKIAAKLVSLKSVSSDNALKTECEKTAEFLADLISSYGFKTDVIKGYGNPVVFGSYELNPSLETVLIYGHYDVQPASKSDGWNSDPFKMTERNGRLYGRGIMDDKCQFLIHILSIGQLIKENKLGYNIKFLFEGNEEVGSPFIENFIKDNRSLLSCDFILISDGEMTNGKPTLELGNRGVLNMTLAFTTANSDIHSGIYGGAAPNAVYELTKFVSNLLDDKNRINIEGFYDNVDEIEEGYSIPFDMQEYKNNSGTKAILTEEGYDFYTQTGLRPSMTVTGIYGGHIKEGHKTSIPASATAKISFRLVKSQSKTEIEKLIKNHVAKNIPNYVTYNLSFDEHAGASKTDKNNIFVLRTKEILEKQFGKKVIYRYVGGTEPVILYFQQILKKPIVSVPFANEDGFMHGVNENFRIENIEKGLAFSKTFFKQ